MLFVTLYLADYQASKTLRIFADIMTILLCLLSMALCSRSIYRQLKLVKVLIKETGLFTYICTVVLFLIPVTVGFQLFN